MPWLLLTLFLVISAVRPEPWQRVSRGMLGMGSCWMALAIWPAGTWFLLLAVSVAAAIDYHHLTIDLLTERVPVGTPRTIQGRTLYSSFAFIGLGIVGAGLAVPALRSRGVAWSFPVIFGAAWILLGFLMRRVRLPGNWRLVDDAAKLMPRAYRSRRLLAPLALWLLSFGSLVTLAILARWFTRTKLADYPTLLNLVLDKIRLFGQMPLQPHVLDDHVRLLWAHVFAGPAVETLWFSALGLLLLLPLALIFPFIQVRHMAGAAAIASGARLIVPFGRAVVLTMTLTLSILWVLAARLDLWFAALAAIAVGSVLDLALNVGKYPPLYRLGTRPKILASMLLIAAVVLNIIGTKRLSKREPTTTRTHLLALTKQIRNHAEPQAPILAPMALGGPLAADTGRPVIMDEGVMNISVRRRLLQLGKAMFGAEEDLLAFCQRLDARYLVVEAATMLDLGSGGFRYDGNHPQIRSTCAAYKLHFEPETLQHFQLLYTGPIYRLYKIGQPWRPLLESESPSYPTWKRANFSSDRLGLAPQPRTPTDKASKPIAPAKRE